jgi:DNA polymerase elongation subunit (family B)
VIVIAYNYYPTFKPPSKEQIKPATFLKEWESDEKTILSQFYSFLVTTKKTDTCLKIAGFNVTKFDLPYLFGRMEVLGIASKKELHELLFRPFGVDMFQLSAIISPSTKKHEQLWGVNHKEASRFFQLQEKEGTGDECSRFYDAKEFEKIMKYSTQEFNFEQMLNAFYLHVEKRFLG